MSRSTRWLLALLLVFVVANAVPVVLNAGTKAQQTADWSTFRRGGQGAGALYGLLERLGHPVARNQDVLTKLPADCAQLWVLYPTTPLAHEELSALESWVYEGGQLVCSWDFLVYANMFAAQMMRGDSADSPFPMLAEARPSPPELNLSGLGILPGKRPGVYASPGLREGLLEEVRLLHFPEGRGLADYKGWTPLVKAQGEVLVAAAPVGEGWVLFLADSGLLGNAAIGEHDNAVFASNIAAMAPGRIYFDEHHHGFSGRPRSVLALVRESRGGPAAAVVALGLLFMVVAVGWRFGRAQEPPAAVRRSSLEYVHSLAGLYRHAGARQIAVRALYESVRRRAVGSARTGELSNTQLAQLAASQSGLAPHEVEALLADARAGLETGCASDIELLRMARGLARLGRRGGMRQGASRPAGR